MDNEKLAEIGKKLSIPHSDVNKINRERRKKKLYTILIGGLASLISLLIGYFIGKGCEPKMEHRGYPYGVYSGSWIPCGAGCIGIPVLLTGIGFFVLISHQNKKKKHRTVIGLIIILFSVVSVLALIGGYQIGQPVEYYSEGIDYGVYSREQKP